MTPRRGLDQLLLYIIMLVQEKGKGTRPPGEAHGGGYPGEARTQTMPPAVIEAQSGDNIESNSGNQNYVLSIAPQELLLKSDHWRQQLLESAP